MESSVTIRIISDRNHAKPFSLVYAKLQPPIIVEHSAPSSRKRRRQVQHVSPRPRPPPRSSNHLRQAFNSTPLNKHQRFYAHHTSDYHPQTAFFADQSFVTIPPRISGIPSILPSKPFIPLDFSQTIPSTIQTSRKSVNRHRPAINIRY